MGGGQLYVLRRANHLRAKGYSVSIVVSYHNSSYYPLEKDFASFPLLELPELQATSSRLSKVVVQETINKFRQFVGECDEVMIESHTIVLVEWGEILSADLGGKHLAYPLSDIPLSDYIFNPAKKISHYKLYANQFYGCNSVCLKQIFESEEVPRNYVNIGFDIKELADYSIPSLSFKKEQNDFVVSTVGRLDKMYIEPLIKGCIELAERHQEKKIVLLVAGGSMNPQRVSFLHGKYNNKSLNLKNLNIIYTGYINVLGKDLFHLSDVFVGMGTASINSISQGCLTINVDPTNNMEFASGFFGYDTNNFAFSENGKLYTISEKIEEALLMSSQKRKMIVSQAKSLYENEFVVDRCFDRLDTIIENLPNTIQSPVLEVSPLYRICVRLIYWLHDVLKGSIIWEKLRSFGRRVL